MELKNIQHRFTLEQQVFFKEFEEYIDCPLYFIGSICRLDYFPGKSDLDIEIFTDNEYELLHKIKKFLHTKNLFVKVITYKIDNNDVSAYLTFFHKKIKYTTNFSFDLVIYNKVSKKIVLEDKKKDKNIPVLLLVTLIFTKILHYYLYIINNQLYKLIKNQIMLFNNNNKTITTSQTYNEYVKYYKSVHNKEFMVKPIYLSAENFDYENAVQ